METSEHKLLGVFGVLIFLIAAMGFTGIFQVEDLSRRMDKLGRLNLSREKAVLEMKIYNSSYASAVRNYVFWRVSRYLEALAQGANLENAQASAQAFRGQLRAYEKNSTTYKMKLWAKQADDFFSELNILGGRLFELADKKDSSGSDEDVKKLLMVFENRIYALDNLLDNTMGKENLDEIERELLRTDIDRKKAVLFLVSALAGCVLVSMLLASQEYRRRNKDKTIRQQLLNQMLNMEESERKNLSAQVHDQMGQDLSALRIYLGIIEQDAALNEGAKAKLDKCRKIVSELLEKSHNIAFLLRPPALDEVGLVESLEVMLLDYRHLSGINYNYVRPQAHLELSSEYNLLFYRIAQELMTNMAKHSQAKNVSMKLGVSGKAVEFLYNDDGVGFDYKKMFERPLRRNGDKLRLGLLGLRERVELFGGEMRIYTAAGRGTRIAVKLPI